MFQNKLFLYLIFLGSLISLSILYSFFTSPHLRNFLGEKVFLELHFPVLAAKILELGQNNNSDYRTFFLLGRIYFVEGRLLPSTNNYTKSLELNPDHKESYYGRGLSYGFRGDNYLIQAQNDFEKYIELEQKEFNESGRRAYGAWAGYNDLAWIHFLKGDFIRQEETARQGLELTSGNAWLQNMLGVALLAQKKCSEAKKHLDLAKILLANKTAEEFGEAYSGDDSRLWEQGKEAMKKTIEENSLLCEKQKVY
jgi:tetratricopeptide (TPR) repeat protein